MKQNNIKHQAFRRTLLGLAAVAGLAIGACQGDDAEDDYDVPLEVQTACADYCAKAKECNDETDEDQCVDNCIGAMGDCQVEELDPAVETLESCSNETCDDFIGCSVNVGAQCVFGI